MFFVKNGSADQRREIVEEHAKLSMAAGLVLATVNFEWTFRRLVKVMSNSPLPKVKKRLSESFGIEKFKAVWREEVMKGTDGTPSLVEMFKASNVPWSGSKERAPGIIEAFHERDKMVHGCRCKNGDSYLRKRIDILLSAVDAMEGFAASRGRDFYSDINGRSRTKRQTARRDEGYSAPKRG